MNRTRMEFDWKTVMGALFCLGLYVTIASGASPLSGGGGYVEHKVIVRNTSSRPVKIVSGPRHYALTVKSPVCGSLSSGSSSVLIRFNTDTIPPGSSATASYRTGGDDLVTQIKTEWTMSGARSAIECEVRPNTCGDQRTRDYVCTITTEHLVLIKNNMATKVQMR